MPSSYQAPNRKDAESKTTYSQSLSTNVGSDSATVKSILDGKTGGVISIGPDDTLHDAVKVLSEKRIGALVVTDGGALTGILSERDIVRKLAETPGQTLPQKVSDVMTKKVETCSESDALVSVLKKMSEGRFRHLPVMEGSKVVGMVTIGDVVNFRLTELEHEALQLKQLIVG